MFSVIAVWLRGSFAMKFESAGVILNLDIFLLDTQTRSWSESEHGFISTPFCDIWVIESNRVIE